MNGNMETLIDNILEYLKGNVEAAEDCCGNDDDVNYTPAKKALEEAQELKNLITTARKIIEELRRRT